MWIAAPVPATNLNEDGPEPDSPGESVFPGSARQRRRNASNRYNSHSTHTVGEADQSGPGLTRCRRRNRPESLRPTYFRVATNSGETGLPAPHGMGA
jgi:hypothetical protein